jgi:hypothetical protein
MNYFREFSDVVDQLSSMTAFSVMGLLFLVVSIGGWYTGNLIQWLRN